MGRGGRSLWVGHRAVSQGVGTWNMLLEGNLDSDSILGNPSSLSPCMAFFQRPGHLPLHSSARPPACCSSHALPPLLPQVAELQERAAAQSQEQAILQRSLQDKAAEVEVERMGAKVSV